MLNLLKQEANRALTENGAAAYRGTLSDCLDLFATIGALHRQPDGEIEARFLRAWAEDPDLAMKILFFGRDVRGGLGERRVFRVILRALAQLAPESVIRNLRNIPEFGHWDDLLPLLDPPFDPGCRGAALELIREQLRADQDAVARGGAVSLLAKWLPSVNASNPETVRQAKRVARGLGMNDAAYRRTLSALRAHLRILENDLRERDYRFDYEQQPAGALFKYRKAFLRHDAARYQAFLEQVRCGERRMHTGTLLPYELVRPFFTGRVPDAERRAIDTAWNALEDFTGGGNALAVVDGSGSMYGGGEPMPATVALSLGIYFAERNRGAFHNHFITFSRNPLLVEIRGGDIYERLRYCAGFNQAENTNIQGVFDLLLRTAVRNRLPQAELPERLYILSDMEFDRCAEGASVTTFAAAKRRWAAHGYRLPEVVFWNVASRQRQQPVTRNEQGVTLVSGCSPRLFAMVAAGCLTPYQQMMRILGAERYAGIAA